MEKAPKQGHPSQNNKYEDQNSRGNAFRDETLLEDRLLSKSPLMGTSILGENIIAPSRANAIVQTEPEETEETTVTDESDLQGELMEMSATKTNELPTDPIEEAASEISRIMRFWGHKKKKAIKAYKYLASTLTEPKQIKDFQKKYPALWADVIDNLPGSFIRSDAFGLFAGVAEDEDSKLIDLFKSPKTWESKNFHLLELALELVARKFIVIDPESENLKLSNPEVEAIIQSHLPTLTDDQTQVLEKHHFVDGEYVAQPYAPEFEKTGLFRSRILKGVKMSGLFSKKPLEIKDVSLEQLTKMMGPMGGAEFTSQTNEDVSDDLKEKAGKVSILKDNERRLFEIKSALMPMKGINYQGSTFAFRTDESLIQGLNAIISFPPKGEKEEKGYIDIEVEKLIFNNIRMISPESTMALGRLEINNLCFRADQTLGFKFSLLQLTEAIYLVLNQFSLMSSGIFITLQRMTEAKNQDEINERKEDQTELKAFMQQEFMYNLSMSMSFSDLNISNLIYVDQDLTGETVNADKPTPIQVSSIDKLSAHSDEKGNPAGLITLNAAGTNIQDKESLYKNKKKLRKLVAKRDGINGDKNRKKRIDRKITERSGSVDTEQAGLEYKMDLNLNNLETSESVFTEELMESILSDNVSSIDGLGKATVSNLNLSTTFNESKVKQTSISLTDFAVPDLWLNDIGFTDEKTLGIYASKVNLLNTKASATIKFKDSSEDENTTIGAQAFELKKEVDVLQTRLKDLEAKKQSSKASGDPDYEQTEQNYLVKKAEYDLKVAEYKNSANPVEEIQIHSLSSDNISLKNMSLQLLELDLQAWLGKDKPAEIKNLAMKDFAINMHNLSSINVLPEEGKETMSVTVGQFLAGEGDEISKKDKLGNEILTLGLHDVIAKNISIEGLQSGGINYDVKTLSGSADLSLNSFNGKEKTASKESSFKMLPLSPVQDADGKDQSAISGSSMNGISTLSIRIPEVDIPQLDIGSNEMAIKAKGDNPSTLKDIEVEFEYNPKTQVKDANNQIVEVPSWIIKCLYVNNVQIWGLDLQLMKSDNPKVKKGYSINFPGNTFANIEGLSLDNYRMAKSPNPDNQGENEWHYQPGTEKGTLSTAALKLPKAVAFKDIKENVKATLRNGRWDQSTFTFLEHGGLQYSIANLDASAEANFGKNSLTTSLNSKTVAGSYREEKGDGPDAKTTVYLTNEINLDEIDLDKLNVVSNNLSIDVPQASKGVQIKDMQSVFDITIIKPSENQLKQNPKAKSDLTFNLQSLDIKTLTAAGLHIHKKDIQKDEQDNVTKNQEIDIKMPDQVKSSINAIHAEAVKIHMSPGDKTKLSGKIEAGNESIKGLDINGLNVKIEDHLKNTVSELISFPLEAQELNYQGNADGSMEFEIKDFDIDYEKNTDIKYNFSKDGYDQFLKVLSKNKDLFDADSIKVIKDKAGNYSFVLKNPTLKNLSVNYDGSTYELSGKIQGNLTVENGSADFGNGNEDAWIISADQDVVLTNLNVQLGKSLLPEEKEIVTRNGVDHEVTKSKNVDLPMLDNANGSLKLTIGKFTGSAINVVNGEVDFTEIGTVLGYIMKQLVTEYVNFGDNAMEFFNWLDTYAAQSDSEWHNPLFEQLNINDRKKSKEYFGNWVEGQFRRANIVQGSSVTLDESGYYLHIGDVLQENSIKIADNDFSMEALSQPRRFDNKMKLSSLIEYQINKHGALPEEGNKFLPAGWDPNDYATLEELFGEIYTNTAVFEEFMGAWIVGKDVPNGDTIGEAIGLWVNAIVIKWISSHIDFKVNLNNIDLEKVEGFNYTQPNPDGVSMNINGNIGASMSKIDIGTSHIPGFNYKTNDNQTIISSSGIQLDHTIFESKQKTQELFPGIFLIEEDRENTLSNKKITISGLSIKKKK